MRYTALALLVLCSVFQAPVQAQKKVLDHPDFDIWNTIESPSLSSDGQHVMYSLERGEADNFLYIHRSDGREVLIHDRAQDGRFTRDARYALFTIKAWKDSVDAMKRRKLKKKDLPLDSLGIFELSTSTLVKIPRLKNYKVPEEWSGFVAWQYEPDTPQKDQTSDSTARKIKEPKGKKPGKKTGYPLVLRELQTGEQDTLLFVTQYAFAEKGKKLAFVTTGPKKDSPVALFVMDLDKGTKIKVHEGPKAKYYQMKFSESGRHLGFVTDEDTTRVQLRPTRLYYWNDRMKRAEMVLSHEPGLESLRPSRFEELRFSEDGKRMYFGLEKPPILRDTSLLEDEIVSVEVWTYDEPRLYTVQELEVKNDTVKGYLAMMELSSKSLRRLATEDYPDFELGDEGNASHVLLSNPEPYALERQWLGNQARDYAIRNLRDGSLSKVLSGVAGRVGLSPKGEYIYGYDLYDSLWFTYHIGKEQYRPLTQGRKFYNELHDSPTPPSAYGLAGWTDKDRDLIIYDRYDLWRFDPDSGESERLTRGREEKVRYRYWSMDPDARHLDGEGPWMLSVFDEKDKSSGYARLDPKSGRLTPLLTGPYRFSRPVKAKDAALFMFTRQSFEVFPDIHVSGPDFENPQRISQANPQQGEYNWGTIELVNWTSLDGKELTGLLVKPENFDPKKEYPLLVNFYEKSSDGLHQHRAPAPGRSSINYSFYTSRGYVIFNPDVHYREGYPGESAYNCVIPGITSLVEKGFIDKDRIGVQGHSWGGYQVAYMVTKTDVFRCAESGAPVPNMISAYGGIRWWTGLSRQFQYEHTQSRIGGTPWEYPVRYIENSPIFYIDKINTPLLIMHNDADGHVPWYQGIEFFTSLRRLGKPSWFLNYNGEPHWPLKRQNRKDFNIRMAQFFDYYLKDAPKPMWMDRGVPAVEKGVNQGYELMDE